MRLGVGLCVAAAAAAAASPRAAESAGPPPAGPPCRDCPNIVVMMTDDQDELLGGWQPMTQTHALFERQGVRATQMRIHTPICAPSRSQFLSGRYYQNMLSAQTTPQHVMPKGGGALDHLDLGIVWPAAFPITLRRELGYTTALFGKCMNGGCGVNVQDGYNTKPELNFRHMGAFDVFVEGQEPYQNGTFFDNRAANCTWPWGGGECRTATHPGGVWAGRGDGYHTATLGNLTAEWIQEVAGGDRPFFVYFAPHAPHWPTTPAAWYATGTRCDTVRAPRTPDYNYTGTAVGGGTPPVCTDTPPGGAPRWWGGADFHELVSCARPFNASEAAVIDNLARDRCRTLLSVDDAYAGIYYTLDAAGVMNKTYVMIFSDHGYNLGHHMMPMDKMLVYEHSLKIPFIAMGPGIARGGVWGGYATQVDLAPTILGLAGRTAPAGMDGRSLVRELVAEDSCEAVPASVLRHRRGLPCWNRTSTLHVYFNQGPTRYVQSVAPDPSRRLDDWSNTFVALTYAGPEGRFKYAVYDPYGRQSAFATPYMTELFDLDADPHEIRNIYNATAAARPALIATLEKTLRMWYACSGAACP